MQSEQGAVSARLYDLIAFQKQVEFDVVQVQQYLSDYSATRGEPGQDDGLENAEKFAKRFPSDIAAATKAAQDLGSPEVAEALASVAARFPEYYQRGVEMAKVYAASGPTEGNKLMNEFDRISDSLQAQVQLTSKAVAAVRRNQEEKSAAALEDIKGFHALAKRLGAVTILVVTLTCLLGIVFVRRWLVQPLSWITFAFQKLSAGDTNCEVYETARADEIGDLARAYAGFRRTTLERSKLARESRLLAEFNEWLQCCKSLDELYEMVGTFLAVLLPNCAGSLYVYANSRDVLDCAKVWNGAEPTHAIQPDDCWSLRRGRVFSHGENEIEFHCAHVNASQENDYCCIPILAHGETIGMLHLEFHLDRSVGDIGARGEAFADQRRLGIACAEQISMAIANVKLRDQLRDQTIRDPLTRLFNRRYLMDTLRREISRARRLAQPVSILSLDVDHFKQFNDNHGHDAGDTVLRAVGDCLETGFRNEDFACRFGGEEFIVVLPNASPENAFRKAEEIRGKIESIVVRYLDRNLPRISVSIGVAAFPNSGDHPEALIRAADEALYAAKANGRNCVEAARSLDLGPASSGGDASSLQRVLRASFGAVEQALTSQGAAP